MKLTILGSGTVLSKERACSGFLLESGRKKLLIDIGEGAFTNLKRVAEPADINTILLTHFHSDHASALSTFLLYRRLVFKYGPIKSASQLNIIGPKGLAAFCEALDNAFPTLKEVPFKVVTKELENSFLMMPGFRIKSRVVKHESTIAYRIEAEGKSIVFSGDTAYCEDIISLANKADLLVLECSLPDSLPSSNHLTVSQAASIAKQANVKSLLLNHFYPQVENEPIEKIVRNIYSGSLRIASDLMVIEF
ncbi:MAG: MBL fold metallo-hydrolase [Candidatus Diapherotrites archaeon]|nr:MBL fold metallo-hydrolase [Candidatus Diapherotrites archaeon]